VLPGTEEASEPFFSPDGDWIGFVDRAGGLEEVRLREGPAQPIWKPDQRGLDRMTGATWGPGGIVFGRWPSPALCSVSPDGGAARVLVSSPGTAVWYLWPEALPGGRAVLFTIWQRGRMSIASLSLDSGKVQPLVASGSRPRYLATGHLLYESDGKIFAVAFDPETLQIHGHAIAIVPEVPKSAWWGSWRASTTGAPYGVSSSGTLAYTPAPATLPALVWIDRRGIRTPLPLEPRQYSMPTLSPDGRLIADTIYDGPSRSVWISSVEGGSMMRLTSGPDDCYSLFTPDGKWLLFTSNQDSRYNIFRIPVDRSAPAERMTDSPHSQRATSWSPPDGKTLLFNDVDETTGYDILALTNGAVRPFLQTRYSERAACFSPDGRWVAYESDEYGGPEIFVQAYPSGARTPVSSGGGVGWPAWRRNELFYQGPKGVMCVRIADGRPLGLPVLLFPHKSEFRDWDVSPDGQRFLMVEGAETSRFPPHINVVTNWFEELKAKVPVQR
jgi:Tol biopolymer transport system component